MSSSQSSPTPIEPTLDTNPRENLQDWLSAIGDAARNIYESEDRTRPKFEVGTLSTGFRSDLEPYLRFADLSADLTCGFRLRIFCGTCLDPH